MNCPYCDSRLDSLPANHICPHCTGPLDAQWCAAYDREQAAKAAKANPAPPPVQPAPHASPRQQILCCPRCRSVNVRVRKRGYSWGWGCLGFFLLPLFGLLFGCIGASKQQCTCIACGHRWQLR